MLYKILKSYQSLPKNIHLLFYLEFSVSLIHVAFILILNIFLRKKGFSDPEIASLNSLRFISALIFAIPLGIYIRGKKLKPFFISSAIMVPLTSILIIQSIHFDINFLIRFSFLLWGLGIMLMRVCSLPFIIRSSNSNNSTEALSLIASDLRNTGYYHVDFESKNCMKWNAKNMNQYLIGITHGDKRNQRAGKHKQADSFQAYYSKSAKDHKRIKYELKKYQDSSFHQKSLDHG